MTEQGTQLELELAETVEGYREWLHAMFAEHGPMIPLSYAAEYIGVSRSLISVMTRNNELNIYRFRMPEIVLTRAGSPRVPLKDEYTFISLSELDRLKGNRE